MSRRGEAVSTNYLAIHAVDMPLFLMYTVSGTALFIYLFLKFLRRGLSGANRDKLDLFGQNLTVNRKLRTNFSYGSAFVGLLLGLFIFAATAVWLFQTLTL